MIRVLHIVSGDLWAGAEVMVYNLIDRLRLERQIEVSCIILNEGRLSRDLLKLGIKVSVIDEKYYSFADICCKLRKVARTFRPQVIHSHRYKENMLSILGAGFLSSVKRVATQHGMPEIFTGAKKWKQKCVTFLNYSLMKFAFDKVVCVSNDIRERFIDRYGFNPASLAVVHNGIGFIPQKAGIRDGAEFCIGTAGRLVPVKDFPLFIKIAELILKSEANVRFLLAGDGPEEPYLRMLVKRHGMGEHFQFLGHLDNMSDFYDRLDLYYNTSLYEGIPMSVLEAMAHGIPVVAPATGGLKEVVEHARSGFLIDGRDPDHYARTGLDIIRDREFRKRLSTAASQRVANSFSAAQMAESYSRLYRGLVEN